MKKAITYKSRVGSIEVLVGVRSEQQEETATWVTNSRKARLGPPENIIRASFQQRTTYAATFEESKLTEHLKKAEESIHLAIDEITKTETESRLEKKLRSLGFN